MIRSSELFWVELDNDRSARPWTQGFWLHNQRWRRGRPRRVRVRLGQAKAQSRTRTRFGSDGECWTDAMLYGGLVVVALIRLMMRQRRAETSHYSSEGRAGRMQAQTGCVGPGQSRTGHPAHLIQGWTWDWVHSFKMVVWQSWSSCVYVFCLSTTISQVSWKIVKEKTTIRATRWQQPPWMMPGPWPVPPVPFSSGFETISLHLRTRSLALLARLSLFVFFLISFTRRPSLVVYQAEIKVTFLFNLEE